MFETLQRTMEVNYSRGAMSETIGITLLYELGDIGYGAEGWICRGFLNDSHPSYWNYRKAWLDGGSIDVEESAGKVSV